MTMLSCVYHLVLKYFLARGWTKIAHTCADDYCVEIFLAGVPDTSDWNIIRLA